MKRWALLTALTYSIDANGEVSTTNGPWNDTNEGGNNNSVDAGLYSIAVNSGTKISLPSTNMFVFINCLENIATLRSLVGAKLELLNITFEDTENQPLKT